MSSRSVGLFSLAYNKRTTFGFWGSIFYRCLFAANYLPGAVAKKCVDTAKSGSYEVVRAVQGRGLDSTQKASPGGSRAMGSSLCAPFFAGCTGLGVELAAQFGREKTTLSPFLRK